MLGAHQNRGILMIRKLSIAVLATAALSGCMTSGYGYRGGSGDYYHGRPATHSGYGAPYGNLGYGYPGGWYGGVSYGYFGGHYNYGPYRDPFYRVPGYYYSPYYPIHRPPVVVVRPPAQPRPPRIDRPEQPRPVSNPPPWRDISPRRMQRPPEVAPATPAPAAMPLRAEDMRTAPARAEGALRAHRGMGRADRARAAERVDGFDDRTPL